MKPKFATRVLLVAILLIAAFIMVACGGGEEEAAEQLDVPTPVATFTSAAVGMQSGGDEGAEESIEEDSEEVEPTEEPTEEPTAEPTATEAPTPVAEAAIIDAEEVTDTVDVTAADVIPETAEADAVTTTDVLTETVDVANVDEITETDAATDVESLTDTEELTATEGATDAAGATSGAATGEAASIDVIMHDIYFGEEGDNLTNPPVWTVPAGSDVQLVLENEGALEHNWAIVQPGAEVPVPFVEEEGSDELLLYNPGRAAAGETLETTFQAPDVGTYTVICTVAGHYPAMQGQLVVE